MTIGIKFLRVLLASANSNPCFTSSHHRETSSPDRGAMQQPSTPRGATTSVEDLRAAIEFQMEGRLVIFAVQRASVWEGNSLNCRR